MWVQRARALSEKHFGVRKTPNLSQRGMILEGPWNTASALQPCLFGEVSRADAHHVQICRGTAVGAFRTGLRRGYREKMSAHVAGRDRVLKASIVDEKC